MTRKKVMIMKRKVYCFALLSCLAFATTTISSNVAASFGEMAHDDASRIFLGKTKHNAKASSYLENFNIAGGNPVESVADFDGKTSIYLGTATRVSNSIAYQKEEKVTYRSGWTTEVIKHDYDVKRFDTYEFSRYVNIPVRVIDRLELMAGESVGYTCTHISQTTLGYSETLTTGYEFTSEQTMKLGMSLGASIPLDMIKVNGSVKAEGTVSTSATISSTASQTWSRSVMFAEQTTSTWNLHNNAPGERRVYQFNYRQKFKLYCTTEYNINYVEGSYKSGLFNLDTHYTYDFAAKRYTPVATRFFMIPVDLPTLGFTEYHNSSDGREFPTTLIENNVLYL